jgi:uncharacterized damage-inducible protein DinB
METIVQTSEQNPTLATFYDSWKGYQQRLKEVLAPLTAEHLSLRPAPGLRSIGENAAHIIGCRAGWFHFTLGEGGEEIKALAHWDQPGAPTRSAAELLAGLDATWALVMDRVGRWSDADMRQTFPDEWDGKVYQRSRSWVIWHLIEHDLHHGGEVSLTLGMHGLQAPDI